MKKILFVLFAAVFAVSANAQEKEKGKFFKSIYKELFKYGTFYVAGDIKTASFLDAIDFLDKSYKNFSNPSKLEISICL